MTENTLKKILEKHKSTAFFTQEEFLLRKHNSLDGGVANVIYEVTDFGTVEGKLKDLLGDVQIENGDDYILAYPIDLFEKTRFTFSDLVEIIYRLRDPDGCPWDKVQTNKSIRGNIIEEAYELVEAIDLDDEAKMREECGDVILQGAFSAVIAAADKGFTVGDVITELCQKLIGRHTHIFGKDKAGNSEEALYYWEQAKNKEKHYTSIKDKLDSVPVTFDALMKANKVQKIIKKTGFDFPDLDGAMAKLYEEIHEFKEAEGADRESEAGDILFAAINVLRMAKIDPEVALNATTDRFIRRFDYVIDQAEAQGKKVEELTIDEMEKFYQQAKRYERK